MTLTVVPLLARADLRRAAHALYKEAFPRYERVPWWLVCALARSRMGACSLYLDGDTLCGMTLSAVTDGLLLLNFFAVPDALRGKGYGAAVLAQLHADHPDKTVALNIEPLDPAAPNAAQRERRLTFYCRNGFYDTGWTVYEVGGAFTVLADTPDLPVEPYKKVFRRLFFGLWEVKLIRREEK